MDRVLLCDSISGESWPISIPEIPYSLATHRMCRIRPIQQLPILLKLAVRASSLWSDRHTVSCLGILMKRACMMHSFN
jgi:hypothetical protein